MTSIWYPNANDLYTQVLDANISQTTVERTRFREDEYVQPMTNTMETALVQTVLLDVPMFVITSLQ